MAGTPIVNLSRRGFLGAGAGLVVGFTLPGCGAHLPPADTTIEFGAARPTGAEHQLNAYIRIAESGEVTLRVGASEMGQGVYTSLPMILAEELDIDWQSVRVESASTAKAFRRPNFEMAGSTQLTGGSTSVRGYWQQLREAGAATRAMLVEAAAKEWGVKPERCTTALGVVHSGDRSATYAQLAAKAVDIKPPSKPTLKDPADFKIIGTNPARLDLPPKVDGTAVFGMDPQVEGMLHATVKACPHFGGSLVDFDDTEARKIPGVVDVFEVPKTAAIIVVAEHFWAAKRAADALVIRWDPGKGAGLNSDHIRALLAQGLDSGGKNVERKGRIGQTTIESTYELPYLDHAPIEPVCATAWLRDGQLDIWAPTQVQTRVKRRAAAATGLRADKVRLHTTLLGGGFGRKGGWDFTDFAVQATLHTGRPVKLIYTREENFTQGIYRPAAACRFKAALGDDGLPTSLHAVMAGQSIVEALVPGVLMNLKLAMSYVTEGISGLPYAIDNTRVDYARLSLPVPVGSWRSVHGSTNGFFLESFIDELAHAAGQDPIDYRRKLLADNPRFLTCLDTAVQAAGAVPAGQHRGVAIFRCFGSIVAEVADVSVEGGQLVVHKVTAAIDAGMIVHPENVKWQVEGAIGMGLSTTLGEAITLENGAVEQTNFHQYPVMGMARMPKVEVHIVPSTEPPGGVGEPGVPPIPAAVCNAIFQATGTRIRSLPIGTQLST